MEDITFVIPGYNNLRHLKNLYASLKKHAPLAKLIMIDDGSTDDTFEWLKTLEKDKTIDLIYRSEKRVGHTIMYDKGIAMAKTKIVGILHCDMIIGPNYVQNMVKHLKKGVVVCGTRIEPPIHPEGKEKIIKDFGMDFDSLNVKAFEDFAIEKQKEFKNITTKGMFAPWIIYKEDFDLVGGHDKIFAPFPYEDSDIFQRWIMQGFELIQSRDAFVYHLTCRGHRFTKEIGVDDDFFKIASQNAARNYLRKWGSWIENDEFQYPKINPKYNIQLNIKSNENDSICLEKLSFLEPWFSKIVLTQKNSFIDSAHIIKSYINKEKYNTLFDLESKLSPMNTLQNCDIEITLDSQNINYGLITQIQKIIHYNGEIGEFELDNMKIKINSLDAIQIPIQPLFKTT